LHCIVDLATSSGIADSVLQGAGLNLGAATMEVGEIAIFEVHPDFGYGSKGELPFLLGALRIHINALLGPA
jgi:hypothetical protein